MYLSGKYSFTRIGPSLIISSSDENREYNSSDTLFQGVLHLFLSHMDKFDLDFMINLLFVWEEDPLKTISIVDEHVQKDVIDGFLFLHERFCSEIAPNLPPYIVTKFIVPVSIAANCRLPDNVYIGSILYMEEVPCFQCFNYETLSYSVYKSILPKAHTICNEIQIQNMNELETIVWIDNWFQTHVQYVKNYETSANGKKYICPSIVKQAIVPDVLLHHYGVCEDIAVSIATLLSLLKIEHSIVQWRNHAWLLVKLKDTDDYYIWDCTRNITRNKNMCEHALKATSYTSKYTLVGALEYPGEYIINAPLMPVLADDSYSRGIIDDALRKLKETKHVVFSYDLGSPVPSFIKD